MINIKHNIIKLREYFDDPLKDLIETMSDDEREMHTHIRGSKYLGTDTEETFIYVRDNNVLGYIFCVNISLENVQILREIYVHPGYRSMGIGTALFDYFQSNNTKYIKKAYPADENIHNSIYWKSHYCNILQKFNFRLESFRGYYIKKIEGTS